MTPPHKQTQTKQKETNTEKRRRRRQKHTYGTQVSIARNRARLNYANESGSPLLKTLALQKAFKKASGLTLRDRAGELELERGHVGSRHRALEP
jgi:hypothetical protein